MASNSGRTLVLIQLTRFVANTSILDKDRRRGKPRNLAIVSLPGGDRKRPRPSLEAARSKGRRT